MFKEFYLAFSLVGQQVLANDLTSSSPYEVTILDPESVSTFSEEEPLSISIGSDGLSPEIIEKLGKSSNIIFSDLPDSPQFVSLKDYENMMFATNELLDELLQQNSSNEKKNDENDKVGNSLNDEDMQNYESVQKIYDETLDEDEHNKEYEQQIYGLEDEPSSGETSSSKSNSDASIASEIPSAVPASSVEITPTSTSLLSSCSLCSSILTSKTKKNHETTPFNISTNTSHNSSKHSRNSSKHFIMHPKNNHTNQTLMGFHNASTSIVPTTMFFTFLISLLVFAQIC